LKKNSKNFPIFFVEKLAKFRQKTKKKKKLLSCIMILYDMLKLVEMMKL
jgi:hypothetical protein